MRGISKAAKEAERNIVVKLLKDVPRYGRAGMAAGFRHDWSSYADPSQAHTFPSTLPPCATNGSQLAWPTTSRSSN